MNQGQTPYGKGLRCRTVPEHRLWLSWNLTPDET
jgi:hypothetical protein